MKFYNMWPFVFTCMVACASFLLQINIPLYGYTIFIHSYLDIWVDHTSWLLQIILLWTFMYSFFSVDTYCSFSLNISRSKISGLFYVYLLRNCQIVFNVAAPFCNPTTNILGLQFLHILVNICHCLPCSF